MATQSYHEDSLFDRLVDGELTQPERRRLLESLDQQPDGWRRCAVAFLEAQSLREEIGLLARGSHANENASSGRATTVPVSKEQRMRESRRPTGQWLAIAASLLLAFGVGWILHERGIQFAGNGPSADRQLAQIAPVPMNAGSSGNALTLFVRDNSGRNVPVRVPLVDADTLDRQFGTKFQPTIPDDMRKKLQSEGYTVQSKR